MAQDKKHKKRRMGRELKKDVRGTAERYMTRNQALKKLQLSLPDFRRLCIMKGIYPREPKKKIKGKDKTYYFTKDIMFLAHEPILNTFRLLKAHLKKYKKLVGRHEKNLAQRHDAQKPTYSLDHVVKERYPTFLDALRDLDDALCMVHLFATMPQIPDRLESEAVARCGRLAAEFQMYVSRARALRRCFVSIKGIYYQAEVMGQTITWVVPHRFAQELPTDVDYRIMITFLEFYMTLMKFVNFKLFHSLGMRYPPAVDAEREEAGASLVTSLITAPLDAPAAQAAAEEEPAPAPAPSEQQAASAERLASLKTKLKTVLKDEARAQRAAGPEGDEEAAAAPDAAAADAADEFVGAQRRERLERLFAQCRFFLSREVPRDSLVFVCSSLGGTVGYATEAGEGVPFAEEDERITHQVVDRPVVPRLRPGREYVQPQWVYDCVNAGMLLPVPEYAPGAELPPHLSPFVDDEAEGYVPARRHYLERLRRDAEGTDGDLLAAAEAGGGMAGPEPEAGPEEDEDEDEDEEEDEGAMNELDDLEGSEGEAEEAEDEEEEAPAKAGKKKKEKKGQQRGSEASSAGEGAAKAAKGAAKEARPSRKEREAAEEKELAKIMMTKKQKRLYGRMQHGIKRKQDAAEALETKRARIDAEKAAAKGKPAKKKE
eukprot:tig00020961_g16684.t1